MNDLYRVTVEFSWNLGFRQSHPKDILKVKVIDKQRARVLGTNSILDSNVIPNTDGNHLFTGNRHVDVLIVDASNKVGQYG